MGMVKKHSQVLFQEQQVHTPMQDSGGVQYLLVTWHELFHTKLIHEILIEINSILSFLLEFEKNDY